MQCLNACHASQCELQASLDTSRVNWQATMVLRKTGAHSSWSIASLTRVPAARGSGLSTFEHLHLICTKR